MEYLTTLVSNTPIILSCLAAIIVAIVLVQRGTGTPSKLLLIGSIAVLIGTVLESLAPAFVKENAGSTSAVSLAFRISLMGLVSILIDIAGFTSILVGFWKAATRRA